MAAMENESNGDSTTQIAVGLLNFFDPLSITPIACVNIEGIRTLNIET